MKFALIEMLTHLKILWLRKSYIIYMVGRKLFESVMGDFWWGVVWGGSKYSRVVWGGRRWNLDGMGNNFVLATNVQ